MILCPKCQKRNPDGVASCQFCGRAMIGAVPAGGVPGAPGATYTPPPGGPTRTSGMAGVSLALGILGLFTFGLTALVGLILGILGLRQIDLSRGSLQGRGVAIAGMIVSGLVLAMMLFIVPITAAILFPVFAQAREKARTTTCMSHLKQVGMAVSMYAQDYDERLPRRENWCDGLRPYVGSAQAGALPPAFQCPSLPNQAAQAYNGWLGAVPLNRIPSPAVTIAAFDGPGGWNRAGGPELAVPRHGRGVNSLFVDGHVKWMQSFDAVVWKPTPPAASTPRRRTGRRRSGR
jgi:prepilin-type processing-associated H-X9-DG protein